eukprot:scaffold7068_cov301-Pinguiococcus_pyrenoidosus.AAC.17
MDHKLDAKAEELAAKELEGSRKDLDSDEEDEKAALPRCAAPSREPQADPLKNASHRHIVTSSSRCLCRSLSRHTSKHGEGIRLNVRAAQEKSSDVDDLYAVEDKITVQQETPVRVVFELPDGSMDEHDFLLGQTVLVLKTYLFEEFQMELADQRLYLDGELMLDPFSLSDFPSIRADEEVYIVVAGDMAQAGRK